MKEQLEKLLLQAEGFVGKDLTSSDPKFKAWKNSVNRFCENVYGKDSSTTKSFKDRLYSPMLFGDNTPPSTFVECFEEDMMESIEDLKNLLDEIGLYDKSNIKEEKKSSKIPNFNVNINNTNNNSNINNNLFSIEILSIEDIKKRLEENTYLGNNEKEELFTKLEEIKELQESTVSKAKKWKIGKNIMAFILDKGADIAIMFIPKIIEAIQM